MLRPTHALALVLLPALALPAAGAAAAPERADLKLVKIAVSPAEAAPGARVRVSDTVRNAGRRKAGASRVAYFLSKDRRKGKGDIRLGGTRSVKRLARRKGSSGTKRLTIPASVAPGAWYLLACADGAGKVKERSERDNCAATRLVVRGGGQATVAGSTTPAPAGGTTPSAAATSPLTVTDALQTGRAATQTMYSGFENSMSVTAEDGTVYTLTLPRDALLSSTEITMVPVGSVSGAPLSNGLVGAVQISPHGLQLQKPATLTIEPPSPAPLAGQTGFLYHQGGHDFHLYPLANAPVLTLRLMHFSTAGVARTTEADREQIAARVPERPIAQLEQSIAEHARVAREDALSRAATPPSPGAVFPPFFDSVVRPRLTAAETNETLAREAIAEALNWARNAELAGMTNDPAYQTRRDEMYERITRVLQNAVNKAYTACVQQHQLEQAVRLAALARIAAVHGFALGDVQDKLERCVSFEVEFDSDIRSTDAWTGDEPNRSYQLAARWRVQSTVPIGITAIGTAPITWEAFRYGSVNTYDCGDDYPILQSKEDGISTQDGELTAMLSLDLNPREAPVAGQPAPAPRSDYLALLFMKDPKETYRHWNEGCNNPYDPTDQTENRWAYHFDRFHLEDPQPFRVPLDPSRQVGDLVESKTFNRDRGGAGSSYDTEFTTIDLWHRPLP